MARYLITGRSGTGKSTIHTELLSRGFNSFDGDAIVPKMAHWIDLKTGLPTKVDYSRAINPQDFGWNWDKAIFDHLLDANPGMFLCGSADNQLAFHRRFDKVFVLILDPDTQRQRILSRTAHNYGQQPGMLEIIIEDQAIFTRQAVAQGAITIDATASPDAIVNQILERL